jgi:hypothetical protein
VPDSRKHAPLKLMGAGINGATGVADALAVAENEQPIRFSLPST